MPLLPLPRTSPIALFYRRTQRQNLNRRKRRTPAASLSHGLLVASAQTDGCVPDLRPSFVGARRPVLAKQRKALDLLASSSSSLTYSRSGVSSGCRLCANCRRAILHIRGSRGKRTDISLPCSITSPARASSVGRQGLGRAPQRLEPDRLKAATRSAFHRRSRRQFALLARAGLCPEHD